MGKYFGPLDSNDIWPGVGALPDMLMTVGRAGGAFGYGSFFMDFQYCVLPVQAWR